MSPERLDISRARAHLPEVLKRVEESHRPVVLEDSGREIGALIPIHMYRALIEEREALFEAFDRAGERMPDYTEEELEPFIARAVAEARGKTHPILIVRMAESHARSRALGPLLARRRSRTVDWRRRWRVVTGWWSRR